MESESKVASSSKHSTVTKVKKLVETFEWILAKYVMESLNESG